MKTVKWLLLFLFVVTFLHSKAQVVNVSINDPLVNQLRNTSLYVSATVGGTFQIDSVFATVSGHSSLLTFQSGIYYGWVDLTGLPEDTLTLVVTGKDHFGTTGRHRGNLFMIFPLN